MAALSRVDAPPRGVLVFDTSFRVASANERAAEVLGVSLDTLVGSPAPEVFVRRLEKEQRDAVIEEVLECGGANGTVLHRYSAPIHGPDGTLRGRVEVYSDITARRELEKEIIQRNCELAELNRQLQDVQEQLLASERLRTLGGMAAGVAHDINNVLGIILANAEIARRKLDPDHAAVKCMDSIELAARDAVETFTRLKRIGKPADTSAYQEVDLGEIAGDVVEATAPAWAEPAEGSGCRIDIRTNLRPGCWAFGNPSELREALANVMLNAAQAIEGTGWIRVSTAANAESVELTVADSGCGMSEETKKRLFDPFFTTRGAAGTGLGMSMVDAIVVRHKGKVVVESEEGNGTTVTMRFPRRPHSDGDDNALKNDQVIRHASQVVSATVPQTSVSAKCEAVSVTASLRDVEKIHISRVLEAKKWNRSAAAAQLGIDRKTLRSKIREFKLSKPEG